MKQSVQINFAKGLNTKVDPWQIPIGQFESLVNSVFTTGGMLKKRAGYGLLTQATSPSCNYITTLNNNLVSIGAAIDAYSPSLQTWSGGGKIQPCSLNVMALVRNNLNQTQCDSVVSNGLILTTYTQTNAGTLSYKFSIVDAITGQAVIAQQAMTPILGGAISGSSRVFVVGAYCS